MNWVVSYLVKSALAKRGEEKWIQGAVTFYCLRLPES